MIFFYGHLEKRVDMHIMLRAECGEVCDNMTYFNKAGSDVTVYEKAQQLCSYDTVSLNRKGILKRKSRKIEARKYLINEVKLVRRNSAIGDAVLDDE